MKPEKLLKTFSVKGFGLFLLGMLMLGGLQAQSRMSVQGTVIDAETQTPVIGAGVVVTGTTTGTTTNEKGEFRISTPPDATLTVSFIGYEEQVIPVNGKETIHVVLVPGAQEIDEVVVVGYGVVRKRDLTGAVSSVKSDDIAKMSTSSVTAALTGKVAGLQITNTGGGPGDGNNVVRIRGGNSISGSNDPLWVIDGFISAGGAQGVPAEDIESVEILKDASATAIYGAQGANGVIIVTTKRGKSGKPVVSFRSEVGVEWAVRELPMMNGPQTYDYWTAYDPASLDSRLDRNASFDWVKAATRNAMKQSYYASVTGGKEDFSYAISAEYTSNEGIIRYNSDTERMNLRAAFDFNLSKNVRMGFTTRYRHSEENLVGDGAFYQRILEMSPLVSPYKEDGSYNYNLNIGNLDDAMGVDLFSVNGKNIRGNPLQFVREKENPNRGGLLNMQTYLNVDFLKDFTFRTEFSYNKNNKWDQSYIPSTLTIMTPASLGHNEGSAYEWVNTLTYKKTFNNRHAVNAVVGHTAQQSDNRQLSGSNLYFSADGFTWNNLGAGNPEELNDKKVKSSFKRTTMLSYLARINYVLDDKYLFTISGRADGSSKFSKNKKWAYFPSAAVSWRMSEEPFIKNLNVFDNLKIRASYGVSGSEAISAYQTLGLLSNGKIFYGSSPNDPYTTQGTIYSSNVLPNDNLTWESTTQWDLGVDMGFFNNRLTVAFDYYNKDTKDLLLYVPLEPETGYDVKLSNVGKVNNRGFEFTVGGRPVSGRNFRWFSEFNLSRNKNKVISLGGARRIDQSRGDMPETTYLEVGQPVGITYGYVTNGVWQSEAEIAEYPHRTSDKPGDFRIIDTNRDGYIDSNDKVRLGNPHPKFTAGWTNTMTYKNLEFSFSFYGSYGADVVNFSKHKLSVDSQRHAGLVNYWTPENGSQTHTSPGNTNVAKIIDKYVEDGSFIKLKNITLRYSLPERWVKKIGLNNLKVYITGTDLWTITDYSGINPEANVAGNSNTILGVDYSTYPISSSIIGGVSFNF